MSDSQMPNGKVLDFGQKGRDVKKKKAEEEKQKRRNGPPPKWWVYVQFFAFLPLIAWFMRECQT